MRFAMDWVEDFLLIFGPAFIHKLSGRKIDIFSAISVAVTRTPMSANERRFDANELSAAFKNTATLRGRGLRGRIRVSAFR